MHVHSIWTNPRGDPKVPNGKYSKELMAWLEVKKRKGSRVKGERVIQLPYLEVF